MQFLKYDDFAGKLGQAYDVLAGGTTFPLTLAEAQALPGSRQGGSFRLVFQGPLQPVLPQGIYPFRRGTTTCDIFIVAIGQKPSGIQYEAIFI